MSGRAAQIPDVPTRSKRQATRAAEELNAQVDATCTASTAVCTALALGVDGKADDWEAILRDVVHALAQNEGLGRVLRTERDRLIVMLSGADPDGRPWRSQAHLSRLTGLADSYVNRTIRARIQNGDEDPESADA